MKTAVLIDRDVESRTYLADLLRKQGWDVWETDDGEIGTGLALEHEAELILCDLQVPRWNGFRVARHFASLEQQPGRHCRVVVTTSSSYASDRIAALDCGADGYLVKPIHLKDVAVFFQAIPPRVSNWLPPGKEPISFDTGVRTRKSTTMENPQNILTVLRFWGVRGSIPTPGPDTLEYGGNTACVELRVGEEIIIFDAGTGIRKCGAQLASEFGTKPIKCTLLVSHTHWDHIQGFPFFQPVYGPQNKVRIIGPEGSSEGLARTFAAQMESPYFPVGFKQLPGHIFIEELNDLNFRLGSVDIRAEFLNHPGGCLGYRVHTPHGIVAYLPDNEPFQRYKYLSHKPSQETIDYSREQDEKLEKYIHGVDLLIIDCQYDSIEYHNRIGWGHGCLDDIIAMAIRARVKRVCLFHHDPDHDDAKINEMVDWARKFVATLGEDLIVDAAREGQEYILG
ncbi:MAG: hypothetical protein JWN25_2297 [Verrucomicrobiales bacterium]|nr:hypothetical protein [Verrucomicrobiales bacterium]MDB6130905.1 hypothetical protein [Verrucomicrobiales bacterium]